jgi:hypothetical protein
LSGIPWSEIAFIAMGRVILILSRRMCDYRLGLDWWMDLLTTYTQDSELPPLISTIHKSPQHSRSLATASNSEDSSASRTPILSSQPPVQNCASKFKSKSELLYDWRFTANQFVLASSPLRPTIRYFFLPTEPLR